MLVDVHNHVIPPEIMDLLREDRGYGVRVEGDQWTGKQHVPFTIVPPFYDPAAKIAEMDGNGIGAAVVSCPPPLFFYEVSGAAGTEFCAAANEGLAAFAASAPGRLWWLANLPMADPAAAVQVYRSAAGQGCAGAAIGTSIAGRRLDEPEFGEFWAAAESIGHPVLIHPGFNQPHPALEPYYLQNVIGNPLETTVMVERLICAGVLDRHPGLRLVLLHGGGYLPYQAGRLAHACGVRPEIGVTADDVRRAFRQLYFDTITHDVTALAFLAQRVGADHVLLGTDLPFDMALRDPAGPLTEALGEAALATVGSANAASLFGLGQLGTAAAQAAPGGGS